MSLWGSANLGWVWLLGEVIHMCVVAGVEECLGESAGTSYASRDWHTWGNSTLVTIASHDEGGQLAVFSWSRPSKKWTEMCKCFSQDSAYITFAVIPVTKVRPRMNPNISSGKQDCASSGKGTTKAHGKCSVYRKG